MEKDFLYHYTSLRSLALILREKRIRFNSLNYVDDAEEKVSLDIIDGGKYCFVSSWTDDSRESIPMWNLYTDMCGVRIKMPKRPFVEYEWNDPLYPRQRIKSYFSLESLYAQDIFPYITEDDILQQVIYTDDEEKLCPRLKKYNEHGFCVEYAKLGKYKRSVWEFQREWRYILYVRPVRLSEYLKSTDIGRKSYSYSIKNNIDPPVKEIFLELNTESLSQIEILCGPKMDKGDKIMLECLVNAYCPEATISESELKLH